MLLTKRGLTSGIGKKYVGARGPLKNKISNVECKYLGPRLDFKIQNLNSVLAAVLSKPQVGRFDGILVTEPLTSCEA